MKYIILAFIFCWLFYLGYLIRTASDDDSPKNNHPAVTVDNAPRLRDTGFQDSGLRDSGQAFTVKVDTPQANTSTSLSYQAPPTPEPVSYSSSYSDSSVPAPEPTYSSSYRDLLNAQQDMQREWDRNIEYFRNASKEMDEQYREKFILDDQIRRSVDSFFYEYHKAEYLNQALNGASGNSSYPSGTGVNPNDVYVNGYYRSNGTYVAPYHRSASNSTRSDNYSTYPNTNPYTGQTGTRHR